MRRVLVVAVGFWLLIDVLRVWAPSLITIFGQAAATPAELMGAFALACVLAGALPLVLVRLTGISALVMCRTCLAVVLTCRVTLQVVGGGAPQLWLASVGVAAAVAWFCLATRVLGRELLPGFALGVALAATTHAFLGTWAAVWRPDGWAWFLVLVQVASVLVALGATASRPAPRGLALALLPAWLVAGIWTASPARASVSDQTWGPVLVAGAAVVAVGLARSSFGRATIAAAGVVLCAGTALVMLADTAGTAHLVAFCVGQPALVVVLTGLVRPEAGQGTAADGEVLDRGLRPALVACAGATLWVVLFFVYYAGYDLGYRADLLVVALTVVLTAAALRQSTTTGIERRDVLGAGVLVVPVALVTLVGPWATMSTVEAPRDSHDGLRVMAWNLRMGYGMDGTFDIEAVAELVREQDPDVLLLSEIDRAWLLNGGQDQLAILSRLLGMDAHFGPAADPVWGDAVLTSLPVSNVDAHRLPGYDAVTGAQALALTVERDGTTYDVIATHVQPHGGAGDGSLEQSRDIAALAADRAGDDRPVVVGGDFNLEPGAPSWDALLDRGLVDALDAARPVLTSPADHPEQQIDHLLITDDLEAAEPHTVASELSDHLPVVVTVAPAA